MSTARLWIDAAHTRWALVQCDICRDVHRYTLAQAANEILTCQKCANAIDARTELAAQVAEEDGEQPLAQAKSARGKDSGAFER